METIRILLCCGAGMSSGFLAQQTRIAAKKRGLFATIEARSESDVTKMIFKFDILLIGPHYSHLLKDLSGICEKHHVPALLIPQEIYGELDGDALLDLAIKVCQDK